MNKREIGAMFEEIACAYLKERGFQVLERNFRCRQGEIDVIGEDEGYLVFVEVKYRASGMSGNPAEAVTAAKQQKICRTADYYRYRHGIGEDRAVRYDVVAIEGGNEDDEEGKDGIRRIKGTIEDKIIWYKNAFFHAYARGRG